MANSSSSILQEILDGPALQAPPGQEYNFVNPPNISTACYTVVGVCIFVAMIAVGIRMYTNRTIIGSFNWEDGTLILGTAFYIAYTAVAVKAVLVGGGTHQWNIQVKNIGTLLHWINTEDIIYNFCLPMTRISIALQYLRIFNKAKKLSFIYVGCWATIVSISIFYLIAIFSQIFACTPREKIWNPLIEGHCTNSNVWNIGTGAFNVVTDIILVLIPQHEIWRLQMSLRKKAAVSAVFLTALVACVLCVVRLYYSIRLKQTGDGSYYIGLVGIYAATENCIGILCTCLPVFPRFVKVVGPKIASLYKSSAAIGTRLKTNTITKPIRKRITGPSTFDSTWNTTTSPQSQVHGIYETLEDGHELTTVEKKGNDTSTTGLVEPSGHEGDISRGIKVIQTFEIDSSPVLGDDMDLEGQKRTKPAQMDW